MNTLDTALRFQQSALKLSTQRQQVVGSNLANADTPNYKAQDFDFAAAMQRVQAGASAKGAIATTHAGHLQPTQSAQLISEDDIGSAGVQPATDGNTVDVDIETAKFAESTVQAQSAFTFLNAQIKGILVALQG